MPNPISIKTIANKGKVFDLTARTDVIALIGYVAPLTTKRALETRTPSCSKKICSLISAPDSVSLTLSTAATLEWRRRSHGKGVRRPSAANCCALLNGPGHTVRLSHCLIELPEFVERDLKLAITR